MNTKMVSDGIVFTFFFLAFPSILDFSGVGELSGKTSVVFLSDFVLIISCIDVGTNTGSILDEEQEYVQSLPMESKNMSMFFWLHWPI